MRLYTAVFAAALLVAVGVAAGGVAAGGVAAGGVAAGGVAAVVDGSPPTGAAVRFGLRLASATVLPGGTAVEVHYVAVCPPSAMARIVVSLAQRTGAHVAVGSGGVGLVCNGVPRTILLRVAATGGAVVFRPGRAFAAADLRAATGLGVRAEDDRAQLVVMRR